MRLLFCSLRLFLRAHLFFPVFLLKLLLALLSFLLLSLPGFGESMQFLNELVQLLRFLFPLVDIVSQLNQSIFQLDRLLNDLFSQLQLPVKLIFRSC